MKQKTLLTKMMLLVALVLMGAGSAWAQTPGSASLTWSDKGLANATSVDGTSYDVGNYFTVTCTKNEASTPPTYYNSGTAVRCYATKSTNNGNIITVDRKSGNDNVFITKVSYNGTHSKKGTTSFAYSGNPSKTTATSAEYDADDVVTTASATLCETGGSANGQFYFTSIEVEYVIVGGGSQTQTVATPTFSPAAGTYTSAQNVTISCATTGATIYYTTDGTDPTTSSSVYSTAILVSTNTTIKAIAVADGYDDSDVAEATYTFVSIEHAGTQADPYTVADAIDATPTSGQSDFVYIKGIVSSFFNTSIVGDGTNYRYYISDDGTTTTQLLVYKGKGLNEVAFSDADDLWVGDEVVVYGKLAMYNSAPEVVAGNYLTSWKRSDTTPSFVLSTNSVEATAAGTTGTPGIINVTYKNIYPSVGVGIEWYTDAMGTTTTTEPGWVTIGFDTSNNVTYEIAENTGEARTAYLKIWSYSGPEVKVYSEMITFTQAALVVPTYATLPFSFDGGRADIVDTDGLYQEGLDSDYGSSPKLKFNGTGDYVLLQFDERPGKLTFDVKGNTFSGGTFKVQTSEDGITFNDLETYTDLGSTQNEEFKNLGENVRYIRWIYTEKVNGNVALGNIKLAKYTAAVSSITVDPATVNVDAADNYGTLDLDYENLTITKKEDFAVQFYDEYNQELTGSNVPDWILVEVEDQAGSGYMVSYIVDENDGAARTAYFEVLAMGDADYVYSNRVTITQAAPVVFAGFYESFDNCNKAGGNDNYWSNVSTSGKLSDLDDNDGWTYSTENPAYSCARFGTGSANGYAQTPALNLNQSGTYVLTFKAGAWKGASTTLTLTATDNVFDGSSTITVDMVNEKWTGYCLELTAGTASTKVKFASNGRFFLDEVRVMEKSAYEALTATKTVGSNGWATYVPDYNVEFTDGDAFVVTEVDETKREATLTAVTKVPAKTPVLMKGTGEKNITVLSDASVAAPDNKLTVSNGTALSSGKYNWVLAKNGESACFKEWTGDDATLNGKVVLVLGFAAGTSARPLNFIFDDETTTGIANLNVNDNDNQVFDLQGRRVAAPQKGLYIVNGKKVVIK